jgi:RNA polymerase sigma-70 factor (ECF subfamily)
VLLTSDDETTTRDDWYRWTDMLRAWFRRHASPADAEDLAQETLMRVLRHLPELRDTDRLGPWMRRIARNVLTDARRSERPAAELEADPQATEDSVPVEQTVASWLDPLIATLPELDATILRRSELHGQTAAEIATETGLGLSAVKSRVQRGRDKVRARLLACCRFERDRRGGVIGYEKRGPDCC